MKRHGKLTAVITAAAMLLAIFSGCSSSSSSQSAGNSTANYPTKDIQGSVMWSAGGVCDTVSRAIGGAAQKSLGANIIFTNRPGSGGAVSTTYVNAQKADGYELLFGAENPQIAKVMGTAEIDYDDFTPINLFCTSYGVICVSKDSPYNTLKDLVDDVLANPGKVIMATTGAGGLPETVAAMMSDINGTEPNMVSFDGENEAVTAIIGGNADFTIVTLGSAASFYASGDIRLLSMVADEKVPGYEDVPIITDVYPDYSKYLPWGPFYGVLVKKGTDQAIIDKLTDVFSAACDDESFKELLSTKGCFVLNLTGDEAVGYLQKYRSTTSWLLYNSGVTTTSPEKYGIAKP